MTEWSAAPSGSANAAWRARRIASANIAASDGAHSAVKYVRSISSKLSTPRRCVSP
jgi:hypothetical protein